MFVNRFYDFGDFERLNWYKIRFDICVIGYGVFVFMIVFLNVVKYSSVLFCILFYMCSVYCKCSVLCGKENGYFLKVYFLFILFYIICSCNSYIVLNKFFMII